MNNYKNETIGYVDGSVREMNDATTETAVLQICSALATTRRLSVADRALILDKISRSLEASAHEIATEIVDESAYLSIQDMLLEVQRAVEVFTLTAAFVRTGLTKAIDVDAVDRGRGAFGFIRREPIGPILGITAFNGPLLIAAHKIGPAIAAGAPIIIKPSPRVPRAAIALARLVVLAGWPASAIAVLDISNDQTLKLVRDPRLPVISFTGGDIGWSIKEMAPRKHVHLELGGVGAVFVAEDANLDAAARECSKGAFVRSGQSCISVQRIYVMRSVYGQFVAKFLTHVPSADRASVDAIPEMVNEAAAAHVEALVADAINCGGKLICGGTRQGAYFQPTVIGGAHARMKVMQVEAFGPVVAISAVDTIEEAVDHMNSVSGAIHHGIYTARIDTALQTADLINAGGVVINGPSTWRVDHMPYGGVGASGFGREGVQYAIEEFTQPKAIIVRPWAPAV